MVAVVATFVKLQLGALLAAKGRKAFLLVRGRQRRHGQRCTKFSEIFLQCRGLVVRQGMGGIKSLPFGGVYFVVVFIIQWLMLRYTHQRQNAVKVQLGAHIRRQAAVGRGDFRADVLAPIQHNFANPGGFLVLAVGKILLYLGGCGQQVINFSQNPRALLGGLTFVFPRGIVAAFFFIV